MNISVSGLHVLLEFQVLGLGIKELIFKSVNLLLKSLTDNSAVELELALGVWFGESTPAAFDDTYL